MEHAGVNGGSEKVVRGSDGVDVTSQVHVELIHGNDLTVATTSSATLDTESGTLRGLTDVGKCNATELAAEGLCETNGGGALTLTERGWCDASNENVTAVASVFKTLEHIQGDLGLGRTVRLELMRCDTNLGSDLVDQLGVLGTGNVNVRRHRLLQLEGKRSDVARLLAVKVGVGTVDNILHQHGHSHGANSTGHGSDERCDLGRSLVLYITDQSLAGLLGVVGNVVGANVNDNSVLLQPLALDEASLANGSNNNVCGLDDRREVLGLGVADSHGGIGVLQQVADGRADNVRTADNDSVLTLEVNASGLEQDHDTLGRAGCEERPSSTLGQLADVGGAETVDILLVGDRACHLILAEVARQRELDEHTVHAGVVVV